MIEFIDRQVKEQPSEVYNTFSNQKVLENRMNLNFHKSRPKAAGCVE